MTADKLHDHEFYMLACIALGQQAKERGDSPVGAIIVKDGQIIGEGIEGGKTHMDITYHAEIEAIRDVVKKRGNTDLSDFIMYTTHEPCIMCSYVIRHHKINSIVMGLTTGAVGGQSSIYKILSDRTIVKWGAPPVLISGILEAECKALHD